jgi:ABC-type cobalamin/Fe3+-siderophores transport system ATPase subunit
VLLLVTGASGVGKSTVREAIEPVLSPLVECVELVDLAPKSSEMSKAWRQQAAEAAVRRAIELKVSGRHLLLAGDPVPAIEIVAAPSALGLDSIAVCLLDVAPDIQGERLAERGDDLAQLLHHQAFAEWMRRQATDPLHMTHVVSDNGWGDMRWERLDESIVTWTMHVIDTTRMTREEVSAAVLIWCRLALAGEARTLKLKGPAASP